MAYNHPDILSGAPYYDDFDDTKNFLRILFKPGYSVQARELTQLQTLLQNQVSKIGSHIFKNGSLVFGGVSTLTGCKFIRIKTSAATNHTSFRNLIITNGTADGPRAKVIHTIPAQTGDNYIILFLQYLTGNEFIAGNSVLNSSGGLINGLVITVKPTAESGIPSLGDASLISVDEGIFYIDGFFVNNSKQIVSLYNTDLGYRDFADPTNRVGFSVERKTVDYVSDETLKDPANGSYNYNAPGADRYIIDLVLTSYVFDDKETRPEEYSTQDFIELARTVNGKLDFVRRIPTYSDLLEIFARRTYDESGSYTVRPFGLEVKNHLRSDKYSFRATRYNGNIALPSSATTGPFTFTADGNTPPFSNDILKVYDPLNRTSYLDIVSCVASISNGDLDLVVKYQGTSTNQLLPISPGTKFYVYRKGETTPIENYYIEITGTTVTKEQDQDGVYTITDLPKGSEEKFVMSVQPGKAYVYGYEFETINNTNISVDKPRDVVYLNNYEVNANVGNYFAVTTTLGADSLYKFTNYTSNIVINDFPPVKLKGEFVTLTLPKVAETYAELPVKYWSPLYASEHTGKFSNILFLSPPTGSIVALQTEILTADPTSTLKGLVRPSQISDTRKKLIGQQVGPTRSVSYLMNDASFETEQDISRFVFSEQYHGDFKTAYGKDNDQENDVQFTTDQYLSTEDNTVYQVDYKQLGTLPLVNQASDLQSFITIKKAETRRWVPAETSGITSGSTLFVKIPSSNVVFGSAASVLGFTVPGDNETTVGTEAGVVFNPEIGSDISYGSSIASSYLQGNIVQITLKEKTSSEDCVGGGSATAGLGRFEKGQVVRQAYKINGTLVEAQGEVLAVTPSTVNGGYRIYVKVQGSKDFVSPPAAGETSSLSEVGLIYSPCACYTVKQDGIKITGSTCGKFVTIVFNEANNYGDYEENATVFQYDIDYLPIPSTQAPGGNHFDRTKCLAIGTVVSWDKATRSLTLLETSETQFKAKSGWVFQQNSTIRYGGRGWDTFKHNRLDINGITEIEKVDGVFVNVTSGQTGVDYIRGNDFDENNTYSSSKQLSISADQNYVAGKDLYIGDEVQQFIAGAALTNRGRVVYFKPGDVNNPAATVDESSTIILLSKVSGFPFNFVTGASSSPLRAITRRTPAGALVQYSLETATGGGSSSTVIGSAKIRQLRRVTESEYAVHLFDVNMNTVSGSSLKYSVNNTVTITDNNGTTDLFSVKNTNGISEIQNPQQNTLLFDLPVGDIVNQISDFKYRLQRDILVQLVSDSIDNLEISSGLPASIRFIGGASGSGDEQGKIDNADLLKHYILVNVSTGKIFSLSNTTYFTKVKTNNTSGGTVSTLTLYFAKDASNKVKLPLGSYRLITTMSVGGSTETGIRVKTKKRKIQRLSFNSSGVLTIPTSDVVSIDYLTTSNGSRYDISFFDFNNGQTDNLYDYATLKLKSEYLGKYALANQQVFISYTYFEHSGIGPIVVNSYETHTDVPVYVSPSTNQSYKLDTVIDFRPYRQATDGTTTGSLTGIYGIPVASESFSVDYSYYLAKNYKLVLGRDTKFKVVESPSSLTPVVPPDLSNSMTLFTIESPAYLSSVDELKVSSFNHQRYTMGDIRDLENRINNLEYLTKLNLLEKTAQDTVETDTQGNTMAKTSILVDAFTGHGVGDTSNTDYNVAVDFDENLLRPPVKTEAVDLDFDSTLSTNITTNGTTKLITLDYTTEPAIVQPLCSNSFSVNTFVNTIWIGTMSLSPSSDSWFDDTKTPTVLNSIDGENDTFKNMKPGLKNNNLGALSTIYNGHMTYWMGRGTTRGTGGRRFYRNGILSLPRDIKSTNPNTSKIKVAEKVVDTDISPYMREKEITITVTGLKPRTVVYPYFDSIRVDQYCKTTEGNDFVNGSSNKTDSTGGITFKFKLPSGKFKTGEKLFTLMDNQDGNKELAQTIAESKYISSGINNQGNDYFVCPRPPEVTTVDRSQTFLAQTFFVDSTKYPQGMFIKSVELFFKSRDTDNVPIKLEIRPVTSGYPSIGVGSITYPFASKTKVLSESDIISIDETPTPGSLDGTVVSNGTTFEFDAPVHLLPGEHAIVLSTNSADYSVFAAEIGAKQFNTDIEISEQPYSGKMFKTNNNSIWSELPSTDLMFVLNRCKFSSSGSLALTDPLILGKEKTKFSVANLNMSHIDFGNLVDSITIDTINDNGSSSSTTSIKPNTNIDFGTSKRVGYDSKSVKVSVNINNPNDAISPIIDAEKINLITVRNLITAPARASEELEPVAYSAKPRYITKTVTLDPGLEATNCSVYLKINTPQGTTVDVYIKKQTQGTDKPFSEETYEAMVPQFTTFVSNPDEFTEVKYSLANAVDEFSKFCIKIVLYSTDEGVVPKVKDMRIITSI